MKTDTIVAISTALGESAISIVRMSGDEAIEIANRIFKGKNLNNVNSHTINYGHIIENDEVIDEVMVSVMKAPRTFTREDIIEINCHGGIASTNKILEIILNNGARLAEPGEFTKRAFLNGRIDLTQAEAVMDIIHAKSESSRDLAVKQLDGRVSKLVKELRQSILEILANIEVNIDYPEYDDVIEMTNSILKPKAIEIKKELENILEQSQSGKILREGIKTVIVGRPNVGKSSLLNKLMREDKAIVTHIAGTTRDTVEGYINIGGITLNIIDTAGIRETNDLVESIGVQKSIKLINEAELVLLVLNNNETLNNDDLELLNKIKNKQSIIIINKIDLESKLDRSMLNNQYIVETSMTSEIGINELETIIKQIFNLGLINQNDFTYVSNARHISLLKDTYRALSDAIVGMDNEDPIDMIEIDIKEAWELLGQILGLELGDDLINQLFSQFCLGK